MSTGIILLPIIAVTDDQTRDMLTGPWLIWTGYVKLCICHNLHMGFERKNAPTGAVSFIGTHKSKKLAFYESTFCWNVHLKTHSTFGILAHIYIFLTCRVCSMKYEYFIHYSDITMGGIVSQITSLAIVYSTVYSGVDQGKHQSSASLAFVWGIHRWPVNSPHKRPVMRRMFPFDDVIILYLPCMAVEDPASPRIAFTYLTQDIPLHR